MSDGDFNIKLTVRNAHILRRIRRTHDSVASFCREFDLSVTQVNSMVCMRERPFTEAGDLRKVAEDLCSCLGATPGELWPKDMAKVKARQARYEVEISQAEAMALTSSADQTYSQRELLSRWSKDLTPRHITAVSMHVTGASYDEIAAEIGGVTRERARQVVLKALRNMRMTAARDGVRCLEDANG